MDFAIENTPIIPYIEVAFPFMGWLSFLFLDDFEGNADISVAIKSGSTVCHFYSSGEEKPSIVCHHTGGEYVTHEW